MLQSLEKPFLPIIIIGPTDNKYLHYSLFLMEVSLKRAACSQLPIFRHCCLQKYSYQNYLVMQTLFLFAIKVNIRVNVNEWTRTKCFNVFIDILKTAQFVVDKWQQARFLMLAYSSVPISSFSMYLSCAFQTIDVCNNSHSFLVRFIQRNLW